MATLAREQRPGQAWACGKELGNTAPEVKRLGCLPAAANVRTGGGRAHSAEGKGEPGAWLPVAHAKPGPGHGASGVSPWAGEAPSPGRQITERWSALSLLSYTSPGGRTVTCHQR